MDDELHQNLRTCESLPMFSIAFIMDPAVWTELVTMETIEPLTVSISSVAASTIDYHRE